MHGHLSDRNLEAKTLQIESQVIKVQHGKLKIVMEPNQDTHLHHFHLQIGFRHFQNRCPTL